MSCEEHLDPQEPTEQLQHLASDLEHNLPTESESDLSVITTFDV